MGLVPDRFHQLAIYHQDPVRAVAEMQRLGYDEWISDTATLRGEISGDYFETRGRMWFNYEFYGDEGANLFMLKGDSVEIDKSRRPSELEFLHYDGESWHSLAERTDDFGNIRDDGEPFLSHMSVYVEDCYKEVERIQREYGLKIAQWFETSNHTNPYLVEKRKRFYEFVFDARVLFGFDLKIIERIQD